MAAGGFLGQASVLVARETDDSLLPYTMLALQRITLCPYCVSFEGYLWI